MCQFFSIVSDGAGNTMYFNAEQRKQIIAGKLFDKNGNIITETDSHSSIMAYNGIFGQEEDMYNKYEYNPLTKEFIKDKINNKDDSELVRNFCTNLDYKTIVPELQIKEIINPKNIIHSDNVNDSEIALLHMWDSVWSSVRSSVKNPIESSVRSSVGNSVWSSVWNSVWNSVRNSIWNSVWSSIGNSVWSSVGSLVGIYASSFFTITNWKYINYEEGKNPFQSCIDLWHLGLIPSYDGNTWRLHKMCDNAKIIYEWKK